MVTNHMKLLPIRLRLKVTPILIMSPNIDRSSCFSRIRETFRQSWGTQSYCKTSGDWEGLWERSTCVRISGWLGVRSFKAVSLIVFKQEVQGAGCWNTEQSWEKSWTSDSDCQSRCDNKLVPVLHTSIHSHTFSQPINLKEETRVGRRERWGPRRCKSSSYNRWRWGRWVGSVPVGSCIGHRWGRER